MTLPSLTPDEFVLEAKNNKIGMIDGFAGILLDVGRKSAEAIWEYRRLKLTAEPKSVELAEAWAESSRLAQLYDTYCHVISALQSTLKAERELLRDNDPEQ